jgi:hypothetical protein
MLDFSVKRLNFNYIHYSIVNSYYTYYVLIFIKIFQTIKENIVEINKQFLFIHNILRV